MNPIEAAILAGNITSAMDKLSTLDLSPVTNAADIEAMRAEAERMTRDLLGYLLSSENFIPVVEADDAVPEWAL
jgi:hypothetical protein